MTIGPSGSTGGGWALDLPMRAHARTPGYLPANAPGAARQRQIQPAPVDRLTLQPVPAPVDRPEVPPIPVPRDRMTLQPAPVPRGSDGLSAAPVPREGHGLVAAPLPPPDAPTDSTLTVPAGPLPRDRG